MKNDIVYLGVSGSMQMYIDAVIADGRLEEKEIQFLRCKALDLGDDPDEVEIVAKSIFFKGKEVEGKQENANVEKSIITIFPQRNIFLLFWNALRKYAVFKGRASRTEFWSFVLIAWIVWVSILIIDMNMNSIQDNDTVSFLGFVWFLFPFSMLLPFISVWVRRIHDTGKSGWFIVLPIYNIFLLFIVGDKGVNAYGINTLQPIIKEVLIDKNKANKIRNTVKNNTLMAKLDAVAGILFAIGGSLEGVEKHEWFPLHSTLVGISKWLWLIGGILLLFFRSLKWFKSNNRKILGIVKYM